MDIVTAVKTLKEKYSVLGKSQVFEVKTNYYDKSGESVSLILYEENSEAYINDGAEVANGVGYDLEESELKTIAKAFGFYLDDWHITKKFESVQDVKAFIDLYLHIRANYYE